MRLTARVVANYVSVAEGAGIGEELQQAPRPTEDAELSERAADASHRYAPAPRAWPPVGCCPLPLQRDAYHEAGEWAESRVAGGVWAVQHHRRQVDSGRETTK